MNKSEIIEILNKWLKFERKANIGVTRYLYGNRPNHLFDAGLYWKRVLKAYGLKSKSSVLDIGCGCGKMALHLVDELKNGSFDGIDILAKPIEFCKENIQYDNFHFTHVDIENGYYNPHSENMVTESLLPYDDNSFDFITLFSVFTHMHYKDIEAYLQEIKRVLRPNGLCIATYFFKGQSHHIKFPHSEVSDGITYYSAHGKDQLKAIAFMQKDLASLYEEIGLKIEDVYSGRGFKKGVKNLGRLTHMQDCFVVRKVS